MTLDDAILIDQDGGRHPVSKPILAVNSKFFLALFSKSPDQQDTFPITIVKRSSSTAEGLALVLSSMVREEVEVNEENVMEVMQTAEYLQVESLSQYCQQVRSYIWGALGLEIFISLSQWLAAQLDGSNAIGFWLSAQDLFLEELNKEAWSYIAARPEQVFESDELLHLPAHHLATIIASDQITCKEEQVM